MTLLSTGGIGTPLTLNWNLAPTHLAFDQSVNSTDIFDIDASRGTTALQSLLPGVYYGAASADFVTTTVPFALNVAASGAGVPGNGDWGANGIQMHPANTHPRYVTTPAGFQMGAVRDHQIYLVESGTADWTLIYRASGNQPVTEVRLWVMRLGDLPS